MGARRATRGALLWTTCTTAKHKPKLGQLSTPIQGQTSMPIDRHSPSGPPVPQFRVGRLPTRCQVVAGQCYVLATNLAMSNMDYLSWQVRQICHVPAAPFAMVGCRYESAHFVRFNKTLPSISSGIVRQPLATDLAEYYAVRNGMIEADGATLGQAHEGYDPHSPRRRLFQAVRGPRSSLWRVETILRDCQRADGGGRTSCLDSTWLTSTSQQ